jgi:molybdopterin biosynthesis enzyme
MMPSTDNGLASSADLAPGAATQIISQLTPLHDVLAMLRAIEMAGPQTLPATDAIGMALAVDLAVPSLPAEPVALADGYAVQAEETQDAGGYAPVHLVEMPVRVAIGDRMPSSADAVMPPDAIRFDASGAEALASVTVGDGCAPAGADWSGGVLRATGERLRLSDIAVLAAAGLPEVQVRRPRIVVAAAKRDAVADALVAIIARDLTARGAAATIAAPGDLAAVLKSAGTHADAIVTVGATGVGHGDDAIVTLGQLGRVAVHGIALSPGASAALGWVGKSPVLMVPGRIDAALAAWLSIGRALAARLGGVAVEEPAVSAALSRKVTSTIGISDVIPVALTEGKAEPLAVRNLPLSVLVRADGWILVPPESEGYPAGTAVTVNAWL